MPYLSILCIAYTHQERQGTTKKYLYDAIYFNSSNKTEKACNTILYDTTQPIRNGQNTLLAKMDAQQNRKHTNGIINLHVKPSLTLSILQNILVQRGDQVMLDA